MQTSLVINVANLVDMVGTEELQVFDKLANRDVHSWNSLITSYVKIGESQKALNLYQKMQEDDASHPSKVVFVALLKVCTLLQDLERGQDLICEIARLGLLRKDVFVGSTVVNMYAKCGYPVKAREIFDILSCRNVVTWNSLITGYVEHGCGDEALDCYEQMQHEGISPSDVSFICILKACATLGLPSKGQEIHAQIIKKGLLGGTIIGSALVDMYAKCGFLLEAQEVFDKLLLKDTILWNAMIAGYVEQGHAQEALTCFDQMLGEGAFPDSLTIVCILKACCGIGAIIKGCKVHAESVHKGFEGDSFIGSTLVNLYVKCGFLLEAQNVFSKLLVHDPISYNALLAGYTEQGLVDEALRYFEQMIHDGISPDYVTFSFLLKACGNSGCIIKSRKVHIEIAKKGLDKTPFVVHSLLDVYCKSGFLSEASEVFNKLPSQSTIMLNALIIAYAKYGHYDEAVFCLEQMETRGNVMDPGTLIWSLKAWGSIGNARRGRRMHIEVIKRGLFERDELVGSTLIDMYANCGLLAEAHNVFTKLPVQDVVTWTVLIAGFVDNGYAEKALHHFEQMQRESISPSPFTFACSLKACSSIRAAVKGQKLHMEIVRTGFLERDIFVGSSLIFMYAQCGLLTEAYAVLHQLPVEDTVLWNLLISGYVEHGHCQEALKCIEKMQQLSVSLCIVTYIYGLKASGNIEDLNRVQEMYIDLVKKGLEADVSIGSTMVDAFGKCAALAEAKVVFDKLSVQNTASWVSLIAGHVKNGSCGEALNFFQRMQQESFCLCNDVFVHSLKACTDIGAILKGREIHAEIVRRGMERELLVGNTLINMYAKCGLLAEAQSLFVKLPGRDIVSWTVLIAGYVEYGVFQEVFRCFKQMQVEGVSPLVLMFVCCLKACSTEGASMMGQALHSELVKKGLEREFFASSSLVSMYAKLGLLAEAHQVFDQLPAQRVDAWNALIAGYAEHGCGEKGLECIDQMELRGIHLDAGTLISTLKACGSTGVTTKICELHAEIVRKGLDKEIFMDNVLVDTYSRCGLLVDAQDVFKKLPLRDVLSWTVVIAGYTHLGKSHKALFVFDRMIEEGKSPNLISFKAVLNACCHSGLVDEGLAYFKAIGNYFGLVPTLEHYTIMGDMLGRADHAEYAVTLITRMPLHPNTVIWHTILGSCKRLGNVELGSYSFEHAVQLDDKDNVAYFNMSNLYALVTVEENEPDLMQKVHNHSFS